MPEADALRHLTPNHGVCYSFSFGLMGIRRITRMKLLCQTLCERIRITALLTGESAEFREVWRRTKSRQSLKPSQCWPDWQTKVVWWAGQVGREWWVGPWLSPAWLPSVRERGSWGQLQSQPSFFRSSLLFFYCLCHFFYILLFCSYLSCWMVSCSFPQRESWQSTSPSPCLMLLLTCLPTTLFSHFLAYTGMEISGLFSFAFLICTWTSNFQFPFTTHSYFFGHFLLTS